MAAALRAEYATGGLLAPGRPSAASGAGHWGEVQVLSLHNRRGLGSADASAVDAVDDETDGRPALLIGGSANCSYRRPRPRCVAPISNDSVPPFSNK